jgi:hypothetical protein
MRMITHQSWAVLEERPILFAVKSYNKGLQPLVLL